jgi:D-sedoheptulose 7-phosphate isomerase
MNGLMFFLEGSQSVEEFAGHYFDHLSVLLGKLEKAAIARFVEEMERARAEGRTVFVAGNGGSASTASHLATDFGLDVVRGRSRTPLRVLALSDNNASVTASANDEGYPEVFVNQLKVHHRPGDLLIAISASGNSPNILKAAQWVKAQGGKVLGLVGFDGGRLKGLCDVALHVETEKGEYGPVEDVHLVLNHLICLWLKLGARSGEALCKSTAP